MVNCTPIAFHSQTFSAQKSTTIVHEKELLVIFEAFNDGEITSKALNFGLMWSLITGICNTFQ